MWICVCLSITSLLARCPREQEALRPFPLEFSIIFPFRSCLICCKSEWMQMGWARFIVRSVGIPGLLRSWCTSWLALRNLLPRAETATLQPRLMKMLDVSVRLVNSFQVLQYLLARLKWKFQVNSFFSTPAELSKTIKLLTFLFFEEGKCSNDIILLIS